MNRVLIIKLWALGDILMATPMLTALKTAFPGVKVTWIADASHAALLENHPQIDELIALDTGQWRRLLRKGRVFAWLAEARRLRREMQRRRFDAVINCHPEKSWTGVLCASPVRVGLFPGVRMPLLRRLYTHPIARSSRRPQHSTEHYLQAVGVLGCSVSDKAMRLGETPDEAPFWEAFCRRNRISSGVAVAVLAPFSTGENRVWESDRLAALADWLSDECGVCVILLAGPKDGPKAREILGLVQGRPPVLAEGTSLRQYVALLRAADLVICGDSSPMHAAAALGTPFVALFGPTPVAERAPLAGRGLALAKPLHCAPCDQSYCRNAVFRECMKLITVADVQAAVLQMLPAVLRKDHP